MIRIILLFFLCVGILFGQTKWSKCKVDKTKLRECLDGEVKKKEWNKWYIAYECESENTKHYYWVADKIISDDATTSPWRLGLSILGTILGTYSANNSGNFEDSSEEIIPLIEERKRYLDSLEEIKPRPFLACAVLAGFAAGVYFIINS
tara:strand:- start:158 stop:604 length:447 start_codon:yes stop_codon:yes gene_type:complete